MRSSAIFAWIVPSDHTMSGEPAALNGLAPNTYALPRPGAVRGCAPKFADR